MDVLNERDKSLARIDLESGSDYEDRARGASGLKH